MKRSLVHDHKGFTLAEVLISFAVFAIAMTVLALTVNFSRKLLSDTVGGGTATQKLKKAYNTLDRDLKSASFAQSDSLATTAAPGPGLTGDALWFLSSEDPVTNTAVRGSNGQALWQRNILYYVAIPTNHATLYGMTCAGGSNADGYDSHCPHKVLIRKVIDKDPPSVPTDESTIEQLLTPVEILSYMTAPAGFTVPPGGVNVDEIQVVAPSLLTFRVQRAALAAPIPDEISFHLQATALEDLGKVTALGTADLEKAPQSESMEFSIFPKNP